MGRLIAYYNLLEPALGERMMGYAEAFAALHKSVQLNNSMNTYKKGMEDQ